MSEHSELIEAATAALDLPALTRQEQMAGRGGLDTDCGHVKSEDCTAKIDAICDRLRAAIKEAK